MLLMLRNFYRSFMVCPVDVPMKEKMGWVSIAMALDWTKDNLGDKGLVMVT